MQKKYFLKGIIFTIIFLIMANCLNSTAYNIKNCKTIESCDIPTWYTGDKWVYNIDPINYVGVNGSFIGKIENLKYEVVGITSILHNDKEIKVYKLNITGEISGEVSSGIISGHLEGEINGVSYIRVSDLADVKTDINSDGTVVKYFISLDYEIFSSNLFFPPSEIYDFPIKVNESWYISSRTNSTSYFYLQGLINENDTGDIWSNTTIQCLGIESINVTAGTFDSLKIEQTNSIVWYSPEVGNNIKSEINQSNENTTFYMVMSLKSYSLVTQPIVVTEDINPSLAAEDQKVVISGQAVDSKTGYPIKNGNVSIEIPRTGDIWNTTTDNNGFYNYTINAPMIIDDTPTFGEFGSDGVIVTCSFNNLEGYIVKTLTIKGNNPPNTPVIKGINKGKKGVEYPYTLNAVDPDNDNIRYIIDWGDGNNDTTAYYQSGIDVIVNHIWDEKRTYIIKVKAEDTYGLFSLEATLSVTIPRTRAMNIPFLSYLETHLNLFPILQKLRQRLEQ